MLSSLLVSPPCPLLSTIFLSYPTSLSKAFSLWRLLTTPSFSQFWQRADWRRIRRSCLQSLSDYCCCIVVLVVLFVIIAKTLCILFRGSFKLFLQCGSFVLCLQCHLEHHIFQVIVQVSSYVLCCIL